jgi:hypothetical protein
VRANGAIGGYFELELPLTRNAVLPESYRFQSARAAFLALLREARPKRVWMPHYLCDSMYAPLREAGVDYVQYSLTEQFEIAGELDLAPGDWLYYVNYFGICGGHVDRILGRYGSSNVVIDNCQAFYEPARECAATIYSPRKFFGVPDGGLLITTCSVPPPASFDRQSKRRAEYLIERLSDGPEAGYSFYQRAEESLEELEPQRMSLLTDRILGSIDLQATKSARNRNFALLHQRLGHKNKCSIDLGRIDGALCYPLLVDSMTLRERLIAERIFVPTYWKDVLGTVDSGSLEAFWVRNLVPLPCDQRYGIDDMERIAEVCAGLLESESR